MDSFPPPQMTPPMPDPMQVSAQPIEPAYDPFTLGDKQLGAWKERIAKAEKRRKDYEQWWKAALKNYAVEAKESPDAYELVTRSNRPFATVERKKSDLFYPARS